MMFRMVLLIAVFAAFAADTPDPWKKVRDLKTGTDVRIIKAGAPAPIMAKFADLTEDSLIVILKNETIAIPRDKVARIDSRPQKNNVKPQTKIATPSDGSGGAKTVPNTAPSSSYSTGVAINDKTDFEIIYRRTPPATKAK
jgi:hypothetical protein